MVRSPSIRVACVIDDGVTPADRAVAHRRWLEIAPALQQRGVDLTVVTLREANRLHEQLRSQGFDAIGLDARGRGSSPRSVARLARIIRAKDIEIVHGHEAIPSIIGADASLLARRGHRIYHRYHVYSSRRHQMLSWLAARVNSRTIAVSGAAASAAGDGDGTNESRIFLAHNGVRAMDPAAPDVVRALREELRIDEGAPVVLCVSRLRREKGLDLMVAAAARIEAHVTPVVVIVGSGPEEASLQVSAGSSAGRVVLTGHRDDVASFYALADVVAIPSRTDALPFSGAEAMSASVPIVATRVGGLPELVAHGVTGVLVAPEDPLAIASAVSELLGSPDLRTTMGRAARDRYTRMFSLEAMIDGWASVYDELTRSGSKGLDE